MNILVTGGAGYIGSCLLTDLIKKYNVTVLDNITYDYYGLIPHIGNPNFHFIRGDIRRKKDIKKAMKNIDIVIHLAALVGYPVCKAQPKLANEINYIGTKKLIKNCNAYIIFASTGSCYGSVNKICNEETSLKPITEYAITKVKAEGEIQKSSNFIIYRFSTGFGISLRPRLDLLINDFIVQAIKKKELIVFEKNYLRSFIHVKDIVRSILFAIEHFNEMNKEIFNVGNPDLCITKEEVANQIKKYIDFYLKFAKFGRDPDKRNYKVDFSKISDFGFTTKYNLDYGIKEMINAINIIDQKEKYYNDKFLK